MSPNEQQACLLVNVIRHNHKDHDMKLATLLQHKVYTSSFVSCLYASQVPRQKLKAPHLNCLLYRELVGNEATILHELVDLLFPLTHVNKDLLKHLEWMEPDKSGFRVPGVWAGERFHDTPTKFMEQELGTWMNKVVQAMSKATSKTVQHWWSHHTCNTPPVGAVTQCKPDLVLLNRPYLSHIQEVPFTLITILQSPAKGVKHLSSAVSHRLITQCSFYYFVFTTTEHF